MSDQQSPLVSDPGPTSGTPLIGPGRGGAAVVLRAGESPCTWGRTAAALRRDGCCNAERRAGGYRRPATGAEGCLRLAESHRSLEGRQGRDARTLRRPQRARPWPVLRGARWPYPGGRTRSLARRWPMAALHTSRGPTRPAVAGVRTTMRVAPPMRMVGDGWSETGVAQWWAGSRTTSTSSMPSCSKRAMIPCSAA
jgi:hypothetical protein